MDFLIHFWHPVVPKIHIWWKFKSVTDQMCWNHSHLETESIKHSFLPTGWRFNAAHCGGLALTLCLLTPCWIEILTARVADDSPTAQVSNYCQFTEEDECWFGKKEAFKKTHMHRHPISKHINCFAKFWAGYWTFSNHTHKQAFVISCRETPVINSEADNTPNR